MAANQDRNIIYYHYGASPYARKILMYLALRGIEYSECIQPMVMPRADLKAIGVAYRRIPLMAIGKDVYCDTRLIIRKLEELFPDGRIGTSSAEATAIEALFAKWHGEGPLFFKTVRAMPPKLFSDAAFQKDRQEMTGFSWGIEKALSERPEAWVYVRNEFAFLEKLFDDGRQWILSTSEPTLADIEAVWSVHWLYTTKGALPEDYVSSKIFPKTYDWISRFDALYKAARSKAPKPTRLDGATAAKRIIAAHFAEDGDAFDSADPQKLQRGDQVEVFPTDTGFNNKDHGKLLSLTHDEIVVELENGIRLHTPRIGFRVRQISSKI